MALQSISMEYIGLAACMIVSGVASLASIIRFSLIFNKSTGMTWWSWQEVLPFVSVILWLGCIGIQYVLFDNWMTSIILNVLGFGLSIVATVLLILRGLYLIEQKLVPDSKNTVYIVLTLFFVFGYMSALFYYIKPFIVPKFDQMTEIFIPKKTV